MKGLREEMRRLKRVSTLVLFMFCNDSIKH